MYSKNPLNMNKRSHDESILQRPRKRLFGNVKPEDDISDERKNYMFRVLLPNGTTLELRIRELRNEMPIEEFVNIVKEEYSAGRKQEALETKRRINWKYDDLHFTDANTAKIKVNVNFRDFMPNKWHFLWLHDGSPEPDTYEGMWDLTPDTDLLKELPNDYTFETALADLIDNSLQALWLNDKGDMKIIRVELCKNKIIIFDSGPGMNGKDGKLVNWGKMGASLHRTARGRAIGGKPPYLVPSFGMFGYGGPVATMCLGRRAVVSSKVKKCEKVYTLHLEREALLTASHTQNLWRTKGGRRDPSKYEKENSPHGSFMKIEIFEPKMKIVDKNLLQYKLKDIYFPYIQNDDSGKISTPIKFQVNGEDLVGIEGGEVAQTNLHSCNGPDFILQLHFSVPQDPSELGQSKRLSLYANARLKFVYFPLVKGKESIQRIIDSLDAYGYGIREGFKSFSRVSIRRLGRLLPDARWASLPLMEQKLRKGEKAKILESCCSRVICLIDTDAGFYPTPDKTDLAHRDPFTMALKDFGSKALENDEGVRVEILKSEKEVTLSLVEKLYNDWLLEMHKKYDEDIDGGVDQPTIVVNPKLKKLDLSSDVLRVHTSIERGRTCWTAGQKIKVLKGACAGCHNNNVYATLEYMIFEGLPGDAGVEARLICRPLGLPAARGCQLLGGDGNMMIDIRDSLVLPMRIIDSEKCVPVDDTEWENKVSQKLPSTIDLLSQSDCQAIGIEGGMPTGIVKAGDAPPPCIVAVIRPRSYICGKGFKRLDQKFIVKDNIEMVLKVRSSTGGRNEQSHILSSRVPPSCHDGVNGLYIFPLKSNHFSIFEKAGCYTFSFSLINFREVQFEEVLRVRACASACKWKVIRNKQDAQTAVRVGSDFDPLSIACCDRYDNRVKFTSVPRLTASLSASSGTVLSEVSSVRGNLFDDKLVMIVKGIVIISSKLDDIRPRYEATLKICPPDEAFSVALQCRVLPGIPKRITAHPADLRMQLIPGQIIEKLALEVFDEFDNHVKEYECISLRVVGFSFQDRTGVLNGATCVKKVDADGVVDLGYLLKVSVGYGKDVKLSVAYDSKVIFSMDFQTVTRELRTVSKVFENCEAGSRLENIVFEITDSLGTVDESVNHDEILGQSHTLTIKSDTLDIDESVQYVVHCGRCTIRSIPLPETKGSFSFTATHSRYPELSLVVEGHIGNARQGDEGNNKGKNPVVAGLVLSPEDSCEDFPDLPQTPLNVLKLGHNFYSPVSVVENVLPSSRTPEASKFENSRSQNRASDSASSVPLSSFSDLDNLGTSASITPMELAEDLMESNFAMIEQHARIESLKNTLRVLQNPDLCTMSSMYGQEFVLGKIRNKSQSAGAHICKLHDELSFESPPSDLLSVVALLATVDSIDLSRMLAQYVGDDMMRAVVYQNYDAAKSLEAFMFNEFATKCGSSASGGYYAVCLDDIRPSNEEPSHDPQAPLPFLPPKLPNGNRPKGFLGYAVNMISIEASHSKWRTTRGHGLRETLFYRLFGELQVYDKRLRMVRAQSSIKYGAVSLDGGIMRGNGVVSFGKWDPDVIFPVPQNLEITQYLEVIKLKQEMENVQRSYDTKMGKFVAARDRYNRQRSNNND